MNHSLPGRAYIVYPGIIYDKMRLSSFIPGILLSHVAKLSYLKKLAGRTSVQYRNLSGQLAI